MPRVEASIRYSKDVHLFRLGGVFFYQTILNGSALTLINAVMPRGPDSGSAFLSLFYALALLLTQQLPTAAIAVGQVLFMSLSCSSLTFRAWDSIVSEAHCQNQGDTCVLHDNRIYTAEGVLHRTLLGRVLQASHTDDRQDLNLTELLCCRSA